jgi:hypothetical protein
MTRRYPRGTLLALLLAACGGKVDQESGLHDSGPDSVSGDSGPDAVTPCPADVPAQGSACPTAALECQYGTNWFADCVQIADCRASGWHVTGPASECSSSLCPASYPTRADGGLQTCDPSAQAKGTNCWYPEGVCQCSDGLGGPAMPLGWYCVPTVRGCPYPTPAPGGTCTEPGQICGGSCGGISNGVECDGGTWQANENECPG